MEVKQDIPPTFNIIHESTLYQLSLLITVTLESENKYKIELIVPLPDDYPNSLFKQNITDVANLLIYYDVIMKNMYIDLFFVYDKMESYKRLIDKKETFNTKGLGKYMLCTAVQYLLKNTDWFDIKSSVTLQAHGGECHYENVYKPYTFEQCMEELKHTELLFDFLVNYLEKKDKLLDKLQLQPENLEDYYKYNKAYVDTIIEDILNKLHKSTHLFNMTERMLKLYLCEVRTNDDLIKKKLY